MPFTEKTKYDFDVLRNRNIACKGVELTYEN